MCGRCRRRSDKQEIAELFDCGVPCTTKTTMAANIDALLGFTGITHEQIKSIGHDALRLFPRALPHRNLV